MEGAVHRVAHDLPATQPTECPKGDNDKKNSVPALSGTLRRRLNGQDGQNVDEFLVDRFIQFDGLSDYIFLLQIPDSYPVSSHKLMCSRE